MYPNANIWVVGGYHAYRIVFARLIFAQVTHWVALWLRSSVLLLAFPWSHLRLPLSDSQLLASISHPLYVTFFPNLGQPVLSSTIAIYTAHHPRLQHRRPDPDGHMHRYLFLLWPGGRRSRNSLSSWSDYPVRYGHETRLERQRHSPRDRGAHRGRAIEGPGLGRERGDLEGASAKVGRRLHREYITSFFWLRYSSAEP